ncbi:PREDICTED: WD repeat-containing protein 59 isoform X2 [Nicrophorus vespilloides]|uniref:WD repeat-containing protein 59 isoform X2 n=1 Tax=Nicrophorus vespilloides TaxID=110193 RepID=A0ABM1NES7_NICVS|nr:PREDICTED: WD repeat-containing protein 59 isoform X2 [Nicrophorus vespilloides]
MALRWNSEFYMAMEHRDLQANAMALNNTGTYVLLAGRRYIAIRNLDDNDVDNIKKFPRQSKYDVGAAEWNHTDYNSDLCVISSNQRLEVLTWRSGELTQTHSLRAHTRVITDLNWHRTDPHLLASSSVDTFIHLWDLRDSRRPTSSLSAIAEASQVRWNYVNPHILATAHDGDIKLWDNRKGTAPVLYLSAHLAKIHGLDWNPNIESQLATSSQDNTVKFFDINNPKKAEYVLNTNAPVWRARFTPFGNGLVTVVVPQLRRGENSLLLWNTANRATPVHTFVGHRDVVLEFEWRKQKGGDIDFQLVTWSKDQSLLVWRIEPFLQKLCGHEPDESKDLDSDDIFESVEIPNKLSQKSQALQQEFSLLNLQIPKMDVLKMDLVKRFCTVCAKTNNFLVLLQVSFPTAYPHGVPPTFQVLQDSSIDDSTSAKLLQTLTHIAQQRVLKNRTCLEPCLRHMVATLEQLASDLNDKRRYDSPYFEPPNLFGAYNEDAYIPFPRTSGAKFCSVSTLVCFGRPTVSRRFATKMDSSTPRALSALGSVFSSKRPSDTITISSFYYQTQRNRPKHINTAHNLFRPQVVLYDTSELFYVNKQLAGKYILDGDVGTLCKYNGNEAARVGRWDLVQAWTLAELVSGPQQAEEDMHCNPFGTQLMKFLIEHYASKTDIQMAAMLSCVFGKEHEHTNRKQSLKSLLSPGTGGSPYHTIPPADVVADGWVFPLLRSARSNSLDNLRIEDNSIVPLKVNTTTSLYEYYKQAYAEILHRWDLLYERVEILKYMCVPGEIHKGVEFLSDCQHCLEPSRNCRCAACKKLSLNCVVCHISVRGSSNCCLVCGHGGHTIHMQQWFSSYEMCPSGCGCRCLIETGTVLSP